MQQAPTAKTIFTTKAIHRLFMLPVLSFARYLFANGVRLSEIRPRETPPFTESEIVTIVNGAVNAYAILVEDEHSRTGSEQPNAAHYDHREICAALRELEYPIHLIAHRRHEFILLHSGIAVGLAHVWRFNHYCEKH